MTTLLFDWDSALTGRQGLKNFSGEDASEIVTDGLQELVECCLMGDMLTVSIINEETGEEWTAKATPYDWHIIDHFESDC